jgi:hypothetical protein
MNTRVEVLVLEYYYRYYHCMIYSTRHTHKWDGLHARHLLESTHTNTNTVHVIFI